ncbi:MAG: hypothetical protein A2756_01665 [Candidatus Ryanbacteria bacterium RIFCSPHIGHO2_01_FULL_48_27]|uniref:Uncharacterized protein n=1 Tax=Candidatus Ryanbacteria bacterium RIFCSPHIGHO2_01_FULL_48_27 TaxID=1802115 RepID=A0A1G2G518_9BACT|nr:MAG: hypothetical protein A2756_01665 [Candidatus Ryanbacteria bacterium RIFCSPHIGHO2_01_FULL_48_27]
MKTAYIWFLVGLAGWIMVRKSFWNFIHGPLNEWLEMRLELVFFGLHTLKGVDAALYLTDAEIEDLTKEDTT